MSTIVYRLVKGSGLTNAEYDANLSNLDADKIEQGVVNTKAISKASWLVAGVGLAIGAATYTDTSGAGTVATGHVHAFATPTIAASNARTITDAATMYIAAAPTAGTNVTITNPWALYVAGGNTYFGGSAQTTALGVGITPDTTAAVKVTVANQTQTTVMAGRLTGAAASTATGSVSGIYSDFTTANSSFTVPVLQHFAAIGAAKGAASTVTVMRAFFAADSAAIGASNYGYYTDFATASNKYAFYAGGNAPSYFAGALGLMTPPSATTTPVKLAFAAEQTAGSVYGLWFNGTAAATATGTAGGLLVNIASTNSAYTLTNLVGVLVDTFTKGAASTVTNAIGVQVTNAMAVGTNNYGYYSSINSATNTYQLYMGGTAASFFGGPISTIGAGNSAVLMYVGATGTHPGTTSALYGTATDFVAPSSTTGSATGYYSTLRTAATAFTCVQMIHYDAAQSIKGAGSSITNTYGFYARNGLVLAGSNNYGFYSDIASASNTLALSMAGTGMSYFGGAVHILDSTNTNDPSALVLVGNSSNHPSTTTGAYNYYASTIANSTVTSEFIGYHSNMQTANSAFTLTTLVHFRAYSTTKGAASTLTNVYGFQALSGIANGTNNYGFYSSINSAANTWQLCMAGTANNHINGNLSFGTTTLAGTSGDKVIVMANGTAPSTSPAGVGQLYVESGALKFRGSSGTVTTVAPA